MELFKKAAEGGLPRAQLALGSCFEYGKGVDINLDCAFDLYMQATEEGEPMAQYSVGLFYMGGKGVTQDLSHAKLYLKKAAAQGLDRAASVLGLVDVVTEDGNLDTCSDIKDEEVESVAKGWKACEKWKECEE